METTVHDAAHTSVGSIDLGLPGGDCLRAHRSAPVMNVRVSDGFRLRASGKRRDRIRGNEYGRICETPGCGTVLSIYNPLPCCSLHDASGITAWLRRTTNADTAALD